jgi:hypothetical protein
MDNHRVQGRATTTLALAATLAAALTACSSSGGKATGNAPNPIVTSPPTTTPVATTAPLPADFPDGTFSHAGKPQDRLTLTRDGAVAVLKDQYGISTEALTSTAVGLITFGKDAGYCPSEGTYRYTVKAQTVTFRVVSDPCGSRRQLLTPSWQRI